MSKEGERGGGVNLRYCHDLLELDLLLFFLEIFSFPFLPSIIGSVGGSLLAFVLPCHFQNQLFKVGCGVQLEGITFGRNRVADLRVFPFGLLQGQLPRHVVWKNYAVMVFGVLGGIAGLYVSLDAMFQKT